VSGDDKRSEYYRLLAGESARLTVLIENVLDLGRMERGERAYDLRPNAVDEVVEEATRVFAPVANRDGLQMRVDLRAGDSVARIDRGALVQALLNVMDNARKYAMAGGRLEVSSRGENGTYFLSVRDHGPGIGAADREVIFDRFARGTEQKNGAIAGVGLGLYLARTILRAHHGELSCATPPDGGAEFVFSIPLAEQSS
jgi:two-component system phosphate regulon sensor histidine kinase PhoR